MKCIVVGVSSHLGGALARELSKRGARVGGTYFRGEERAAELGRSLDGFVARRLDLTDAAAIEPTLHEIATELREVDALVHCATLASAAKTEGYDRLADVDAATFARMLAVNVTSPLFSARAFAAMARPARSNLILVGSIDGAKSVPTATPYAASKGAVVAMARALAKELGGSGILVNVAAPGILEGGMTRVVPDDVKSEYVKHSALKRFGTHDEIARSIAWLALENTYVTGQTLILDGGL